MSPERDDNSIYTVAWSVLIVGAIVLGAALVWKWYSPAGETVAPVAASPQTETSDGQPSDMADQTMALGTDNSAPAGSRVNRPASESNILEDDPGVIQRQAQMLRKQADDSANSEAGPSSLALTEEQIRELEKKQLILQ